MTDRLLTVVVEDNDALREATLEMLEQNGFRAMGVACAEEIDDTPLPQPPDIYVIDLNLPGEDGLSLAARLRQSQPEVGIVIATARTLLDDRLKGYESGADIYLSKPVDPKELLLALRALGQRLKYATFGRQGLVLDKRTLLLKGPAQQCGVSEAEARLLLAFASARDQTLERWQVFTQLSPESETVSQDSLQVRLSRLRKKIHACGCEGESIKAIRTTGYRFCLPIQIV
jgi:DNA-binding response OmpR family regulator